MSEHMHHDPEAYWPEASALLDRHFRARRRRRIMLLIAALLVSGTAVLLLSQREPSLPTASVPTATPPAVSATVPAAATPAPVSSKSLAVEDAQQLRDKSVSAPVATPPLPTGKEEQAGPGPAGTPGEPSAALMGSAPAPASLQGRQSSTAAAQSHLFSSALPSRRRKHRRLPESTSSSAGVAPLNFAAERPATFTTLPYLTLHSLDLAATPSPALGNRRDVAPLPRLKSRYDLIAYAGMSYVDKAINSPGNTIYMQRRAEEEAATLLPYAGVQLAGSVSKFEWRVGAEFSAVGEKVNYSPYKNGQYYNSYIDWDPYSYAVTDTDSAWIFGMIFLQTNTYQVNDSVAVTVVDTLNGRHYDAGILSANGTNRWYLIQLPLEFSYTVRRGRLGVGISGGLAPGIVVGSQGKYLLKDESGIREFSRASGGRFLLSAGGGLEVSWQLDDQCSVLLRPSARYFLTPLKEENGASKNYYTLGLQAGIRYRIR